VELELRSDGCVVAHRLRVPPVVGESLFVTEEIIVPTASFQIETYGVVREVVYDHIYHRWQYR
jgi:hypothetical protein